MNLKPCPHCHKTKEEADELSRRLVQKTCYTESNAHVVQCNWCGLSGPIFDTHDESIKAWNELPRKQLEIASITAELRHLYQNLITDGAVKDTAAIAKGLLGPQIERLEKLCTNTKPT